MKGIMYFSFILLLLIALLYLWWMKDEYVQAGPPGEVCSEEIKRAMRKMGPKYLYRILPDETLQVNRDDGKWLNLRYERR